MPGQDAADRSRPDRSGGEHPPTAVWIVTVTSPATGRVDKVEVPASCERAAFPTACAWYPQLPLTGAHVEVMQVVPSRLRGAA